MENIEYKKIIFQKEESLGLIGLNSPENLNALGEEILDELIHVLDYCEKDSEIRAIIIYGEGKAFSAGGDISEMNKYIKTNVNDFFEPVLSRLAQVSEKIRSIGKPVIASVHGAAAGAGFNLALTCDFRVGSEKSKYIQAFINIGLIPDMGGTYLLTKAIGAYKALEFTMLGDVVSADEMLSFGLLTKVVPDGEQLDESKKLGLRLAGKSANTLKKIKDLVNKVSFEGLGEALKREYQYQLEAANEENFKEGITAFIEKRNPNFK